MSQHNQLPRHLARRRMGGTSMLEILMAIVILSFGLLGLAALQGKMHTAELESYQRGQALILMQDIVNRIENNPGNVASYVTTTPLGTGATDTSDCTSETLPSARDRCEWSKALKGASETQGGVSKGTMLDGRGCVTATANLREYQVAIVWKAMNQGVDVSGITSCGSASYTPALTRRAVTTTVQIPDLSAK